MHSMRPALSVALLCAALALTRPTPALADEVDADSAVSAVVVYPDRARVTRTATVELSAGSHEILVSGLPGSTDMNSLRAKGSGTARVLIGGLDARWGFRPEAMQQRVRNLQEQVTALEDADLELSDATEAATFEIDYLKSIRAKSGQQASEALLDRGDVDEEVGALLTLMGKRYRAAKAEQRRVRADRRGVQAQLQALRNELNQVQGGGGKQELRVVVSVEVKKAGRFALELEYSSTGSSWQPTYDVRYQPAQDKVAVTYGAWVQQRSGEDWGSVDLKLSTARPALGTSPPTLSPWILRQSAPPRPQTRSRRTSRSSAPSMKAESAMDMDDMAGAPYEEEIYEAEEVTATVDSSGSAVEFAVPGKASVPGDGTRKRVTIASWDTSAVKSGYVAIPELTPHVYLSATLKNDRDYPLLSGGLQVFMDDRFVGNSSLATVSPGKEFDVAFGADERIEVKRELIGKDAGKAGVFTSKQSVSWSWRMTVQSFHKKAVTVELRERTPESEYDKVTVELTTPTVPVTETLPRGIQVWRLEMAPGGKTVIDYGYTVAFPPDERPWGI